MSAIGGLAQALTLAEKSGAGVDNFVNFAEILFPGPIAGYAKRMASGKSLTVPMSIADAESTCR